MVTMRPSVGLFSPREWWPSSGEQGKRRIGTFSPGSSCRWAGGPGIGWGLCPPGLQNPRLGQPLTGPRPWAGGELLQQQPCAKNAGCRTWPGQAEKPEGQLSWETDSLNNDSWARSGDRAPRELPTELCLFSQGSSLRGQKVCLGTLPFLIRTENNIYLVEMNRNTLTWPWPDFKKRGTDTKNFVCKNYMPLPHLFCKMALLRAFRELEVFKAWATHLLTRSSINLSLLQTPMFWYCLASLCSGTQACVLVTSWQEKVSILTPSTTLF